MNIHIRNWEKFQHADVAKNKLRAPSWIRVYTELHKDEAFLALTGHRRAILLGLWIEYASTRARLPLDTRSITRRLQLRVTTADLAALNHAGFLEFRHDTLTTKSSLEESRGETIEANASIAPAELNQPTAQNILTEFIDQARRADIELPARVKGQLAQAIHALLVEGQSAQQVWAGLGRMIERRIVQPSLLPNFVVEASLPDMAKRYGRGLTTEQIRRMA